MLTTIMPWLMRMEAQRNVQGFGATRLLHGGTQGTSNCIGTSHAGLSECLSTIVKLIQNAMHDDADDGKRRTFRINNPRIHQKVFAVGGESAMKVLKECGFELNVNEEGDAV